MPKATRRSIIQTADLVADNATLDGIGVGPLRLRFQLSRGDRWTGRLELNQENAVSHAHCKRHREVTARYDAREITLDEAKRLGKEVAAQCRAEIEALAE